MNEGIELQCGNQKCKNVWTYRGKNPFYATCPFCLRKVKVPEKEESE